MERLPVHRNLLSNARVGMQCDALAVYLNVQKPGYALSGMFMQTRQKSDLTGKRKGFTIRRTDDFPVRQMSKNIKRFCNSPHFCIDKYDPYGYYFINFFEIESQNLLFNIKEHRQAVCLKLMDFMNWYHTGSSSNVCNLPVVFRGGGYAGRAGLFTHGLRFPWVI
jgi:hypothetical protein